MTEPLGTVSLTSTSPPAPSTMKRGRANPAAYSSTEKPAGTLIFAPAGRATMVGAFEIGGPCASSTAAREARAKNDFMGLGYILHCPHRISAKRLLRILGAAKSDMDRRATFRHSRVVPETTRL